jgi:hypothetical protein
MGVNMANNKGSGFDFFTDPGFKVAASKTRDAAKWFLDLMRNLIVVALLFVLAEKSDKWYLTALAWIGFFAFGLMYPRIGVLWDFDFRQLRMFGLRF